MATETTNTDIFAYSDGKDFYHKKINTVPTPPKNIDVDINNTFMANIVNQGIASSINLSKIDSLTQVANNRETVMELLDSMSEDSLIASVLEIYAEDATETNDNGDSVWCVSDDPKIAKYVTFLLDTMGVNKHIYTWAFELCKYGDVYVRLYKKSEYEYDLFDLDGRKKKLDEAVKLKIYPKSDHYSHYVEMVPNPAEMFELVRMGKSYAYIKANVNASAKNMDQPIYNSYRYSFARQDVELYNPTEFVHGCLEDSTNRVPEEMEILVGSGTEQHSLLYSVRKGQSLLYNIFKIWRTMMLIENAMLLNRVTKSSIIRIVGVEVGDMPKEQVGPHLLGIKQLLEQKTSLDTGSSMNEYNNPGPIENNVYIPTHDGKGSISIQTVNDDTNVNGLADVDYFKNKLCAATRIPKQYLGDTDDAAGFNGGTSLSLISSRYAKAIKRIQATLCQMITDAVNLMLIDKGLDSYVNRYTIKMQPPSTQEEKDRREAQGTRVNAVQDIMNLLSDSVDDPVAKLEMLKSLLSDVLDDSAILNILNEQIEKLEMENQKEQEEKEAEKSNDSEIINDFSGSDFNLGSGSDSNDSLLDISNETSEISAPDFSDVEYSSESSGASSLPTPGDLDLGDLSDMNG